MLAHNDHIYSDANEAYCVLKLTHQAATQIRTNNATGN